MTQPENYQFHHFPMEQFLLEKIIEPMVSTGGKDHHCHGGCNTVFFCCVHFRAFLKTLLMVLTHVCQHSKHHDSTPIFTSVTFPMSLTQDTTDLDLRYYGTNLRWVSMLLIHHHAQCSRCQLGCSCSQNFPCISRFCYRSKISEIRVWESQKPIFFLVADIRTR